MRTLAQLNVVAGRQRLRAEIARRLEQVVELDLLIAGHARDRRLAGDVAVGKGMHDRVGEAALVVEHVMRNAELLRDPARVLNVLAGAAGALAPDGGAVIVELERDADDLVPRASAERRHNRRVDAARHGDHDAAARAALRQIVRHRIVNAWHYPFLPAPS